MKAIGYILKETLVFSQYKNECASKWQVVYSVVYHERALYNYFIPYHRKYSDQHSHYDIRAAHDGKDGWNTSE